MTPSPVLDSSETSLTECSSVQAIYDWWSAYRLLTSAFTVYGLDHSQLLKAHMPSLASGAALTNGDSAGDWRVGSGVVHVFSPLVHVINTSVRWVTDRTLGWF